MAVDKDKVQLGTEPGKGRKQDGALAKREPAGDGVEALGWHGLRKPSLPATMAIGRCQGKCPRLSTALFTTPEKVPLAEWFFGQICLLASPYGFFCETIGLLSRKCLVDSHNTKYYHEVRP